MNNSVKEEKSMMIKPLTVLGFLIIVLGIIGSLGLGDIILTIAGIISSVVFGILILGFAELIELNFRQCKLLEELRDKKTE